MISLVRQQIAQIQTQRAQAPQSRVRQNNALTPIGQDCFVRSKGAKAACKTAFRGGILLSARDVNIIRKVEHFNAKLHEEPEVAAHFVGLGKAFIEAGASNNVICRAEAYKSFLQAVQLDPKNHEAHYNKGLLEADPQEAIENFSAAIQVCPYNTSYFRARANEYGRLGQFDKAVDDMTRAIKLEPEFVTKEGSLDDITSIEQIENQQMVPNKKLCEAYMSRGVLQGNLGKHELAHADFSSAIKFNPDDSQAHYNKGLAEIKLNKKDDALTSVTRAIELEPNDPNYFSTRANLHYDKADFGECLDDLNSAVELDPHNARLLIRRAKVNYIQEDAHQALKDATLATKLEPENPHLHLFKSFCLYQLGQEQKAEEVIVQAISANREFDFRRAYVAVATEINSAINRKNS